MRSVSFSAARIPIRLRTVASTSALKSLGHSRMVSMLGIDPTNTSSRASGSAERRSSSESHLASTKYLGVKGWRMNSTR